MVRKQFRGHFRPRPIRDHQWGIRSKDNSIHIISTSALSLMIEVIFLSSSRLYFGRWARLLFIICRNVTCRIEMGKVEASCADDISVLEPEVPKPHSYLSTISSDVIRGWSQYEIILSLSWMCTYRDVYLPQTSQKEDLLQWQNWEHQERCFTGFWR